MNSLAVLLALAVTTPAQNTPLGLRVPPDFEVTEFADSKLANDIYTMTLDPQGRVVVAGRGYLRVLVDDNGDGKADRALEFAPAPRDGAMGLLWEGKTLYCVGDGGLRRFLDANGDGRADGPSELLLKLKTGGEHAAHALRRGPDGWLYVLCGNNTGIDRSYASSPLSPIREPIAGAVLRLSPDLKSCEIVADGFRNPYGMDFNGEGELFAYDSDNERCVSLPWYEPTRFYHVIAGGHYGWRNPQRSEWWRCPPHFVDVVPPIATLGRGSPTGVVCYRHTQFPAKYREGFFLLDWTFGRVYFVKLKHDGSSYQAETEVFLQAEGDNGFAPTGCAVDPVRGDLYISIGGRGTRGAVYRIRYLKSSKDPHPLSPGPPRSLDWQPTKHQDLLTRARSAEGLERRHALELLLRHRENYSAAQLREAIEANRESSDRLILQATANLLATSPPSTQLALIKSSPSAQSKIPLALALVAHEPERALALALDAMRTGDPAVALEGVRVVQLALGDLTARSARGNLGEGYTLRQPPAFKESLLENTRATLRRAFPGKHPLLDLELARTLGLLEDREPSTLQTVLDKLTPTSDPLADIHYLAVAARLGAPRSPTQTRGIATALLRLDDKITQRKWHRDRHWPMRMMELHQALARKDEHLNAALLDQPDFGRADHVVWTHAPGLDRLRAARLVLKQAVKTKDYPWSADLIQLIALLPESESFPVLRRLWDQVGLNDILLSVLARHPQTADRERFLEGVQSPQLATLRLSLKALQQLPDKKDPQTILVLVQALRRLPEGKDEKLLREELARYLRHLTGVEKPGQDRQAWVQWFRSAHPALAGKLNENDGVDVSAWRKRLAALDWSQGDGVRGRQVFVKASCASCHSGAQALGPDLQGVTGRFSRDDLFTAILQPSQEVPSRYRTTVLVTSDDKVYQGIIIYEAVDSVILQTGAATTVRVTNNQIRERRLSLTSLMPTGLLDRLQDRELIDLYAYLKSLQKTRQRRRRKAQP